MAAPGLDPALLLEHGEWLRRLAGTLARGGDEAEDLVQDTWLAALAHPPDPDRPARPWLAEVLRNLWRMRLRGGARREQREAAAPAIAEPPPGADVLLERAMAMKHLSALVVELPEQLRTIVLLRYGEGLSAAQIGELQGVPAGTVRWRLKEALDRLRAGLDEQSGKADWRRALLAPALMTGGRVMMKKWMLAALVALLLIGGGVMGVARWRHGGGNGGGGGATAGVGHDKDHDARRTTTTTTTPTTTTTSTSTTTESALADPGHAAVVLDDPALAGVFEGRVINWSTGQGVAAAELAFTVAAGGTLSVSTDAAGRFEVTPSATGPIVLASAGAPGYLPYAPEWGHSPVRLTGRAGRRVQGVTVFLFPALDYTATVVDPDGKPVAGASVRLYSPPDGEQALDTPTDRFTSDAKGQVVFHAPDGAVLEARAAGFGPGRAWLDGNVAISKQMTIRLGAAGSGEALGSKRLAGRVVDGEGAPVAGALVRALPVVPKGTPQANADPVPTGFAVSGDDGRFVLDGLDPVEYQVAATHDEHATTQLRARAGSSDIKLTLADGGALDGRVLDKRGAPVPSFTVLVLGVEGMRRPLVTSRSVVDASGSFELAHLAAGEYRVVVSARGFAPSAEAAVTVRDGKSAHVELRAPAGGSVTGVITGADGKPLEWARVMFETRDGGATIAPANAGTVSDKQGHFTLTGLPAGTATLSFGAGDHHPRLLGGVEVRAGETTGPLAITLRPLAPGEEPRLELVGIGVKISPGDDALVIDAVIDGGGAAAAGLLAGDRIVAIDGLPAAQLGFDAALARIRGAEGTRVRLTFERAGARQDVQVERRPLRM